MAGIREDNSMGMMIGTRNSNVKVISIKDLNGTVVGTMSISKSTKKKSKRLQYNFKLISSQIMMSKNSVSAGRVAAKARGKVAELLRKRKSSDYDDKELEAAIIHAKRMERIARKRMKHLKEEENAKQQNFCTAEKEENMDLGRETTETGKAYEVMDEKFTELIREVQVKMEKVMDKSMEEFTESMSDWIDEAGLSRLTDELVGIGKQDMDSYDLERLNKKHRSEELREIIEADMKYLKALFGKLAKEKQEAAGGVSLEFSGMEIPVGMTEVPVMTEGGSIDLSV